MDSGHPAASLEAGTAQVWLFSLDQHPADNEGWEKLLSGEEIARSNRYRVDRDRLRFVARRGILRQLLGAFCGLEPARISYRADAYGKLSLPTSPISFSLSKSQDWIAYLFTLEKEAGVDIEQTRPLPELALLAKRCFSLDEQSALEALPRNLQLEAFFHTWTQKEAFIKAQGLGLRLPLADFSVPVDPNEPCNLKSNKTFPDDLSAWKMTCFKPEADCHVAACLRSRKGVEFRVIMGNLADFVPPVSSGITSHSV